MIAERAAGLDQLHHATQSTEVGSYDRTGGPVGRLPGRAPYCGPHSVLVRSSTGTADPPDLRPRNAGSKFRSCPNCPGGPGGSASVTATAIVAGRSRSRATYTRSLDPSLSNRPSHACSCPTARCRDPSPFDATIPWLRDAQPRDRQSVGLSGRVRCVQPLSAVALYRRRGYLPLGSGRAGSPHSIRGSTHRSIAAPE